MALFTEHPVRRVHIKASTRFFSLLQNILGQNLSNFYDMA